MAFPLGACSFFERTSRLRTADRRRLSCRYRERQARGDADHICVTTTGNVLPLCTNEREGRLPDVAANAPHLLKVLQLTSPIERYPGPKGMEEKRKHPRTEIDEAAYVSSGGSVMRCVVRNISVEGAAIDVENPAFVPQQFRLVMAKDSSIVRECRIAWIQRNRIGLTFIDAPKPSS
jgi:hypothetical protein